MRCLLAIPIFLMVLGFAQGWASDWQSIDNFEYATEDLAQHPWMPSAGAPEIRLVEHGTLPGEHALRLSCDFAEADERFFWDRDVTLDLNTFGRFRVWVQAQNAQVILYGTIYFRSGDGWFGASFPVQEGEQQVLLNKGDFTPEGTPAGWGHVDGIRLSLWRAVSGQATVTLDDLKGITDEIVVVRGNRTRLAGSSEWRSVQQFSTQMARNLQLLGINFGVIDDTDIEDGALAESRLAIFPYNPDMTSQEIDTVIQFIRAGGKVLFCYQLPESIQPLLGISGTTWQQREYEGQFATIQLQHLVAGLPRRISQDSWNVRVPAVTDALILGEWVDANGEPTGLPAMTLHPNGVFMGHVLLANGIASKQRMLLALITYLLEDQRRAILDTVLTRIGGMGGLSDFDGTREFIRSNLAVLPSSQQQATREPLRAAEDAHAQAETMLDQGEWEQGFKELDGFRELLSQAYYRSIPARPDEFRAVWCHSAYGIPGWSWDEAIAQLTEHGFNAVVPNMLWGGLAYYPSEVLPVAEEVQTRGDAIAECLQACRKYGVQIHIWKVNWNLQNAPEAFVAQLREQKRLQADRFGQEVKWLCPSHPDNFVLERDSLLEVVRNYAVDGIHFD